MAAWGLSSELYIKEYENKDKFQKNIFIPCNDKLNSALRPPVQIRLKAANSGSAQVICGNMWLAIDFKWVTRKINQRN